MADLAHATEGDTDLHGDPDALHWAERFCHHFTVQRRGPGGNGSAGDDVGLMLTWFAGAIETGKDATTANLRAALEGLREVQGRDGNWNYSRYMLGLYNGLVLVLATLDHIEPAYRDTPEGGYLEDRATSGNAEPEEAAAPTVRSRSCPSCHGIGPSAGCGDAWHAARRARREDANQQ